MDKKYILFNSEYASGARLVAKKLAEDLNMKFYGEKELLKIVSEEYHISEDILRDFDNAMYEINNKNIENKNIIKLDNKTFKISEIYKNIILKLAKEGPCIFMERGCDLILQDREDVLTIFAYSSSLENKVERCFVVEGIPRKDGITHINREKIKRENYYRLIHKAERKDMTEYAMCIDTDSFGIEKCAQIIKAAL